MNPRTVEPNADHRHEIAEKCLQVAQHRFEKALLLWCNWSPGMSDSTLWRECFLAYYGGLAAATLTTMPFDSWIDEGCDDAIQAIERFRSKFHYLLAARRLFEEHWLTVDVEPYLHELRYREFSNGALLLNLCAFLDEVKALLRSHS